MNYRAVLFLAIMCLAIPQLAHAQTEPPPIDDPGEPDPIIQPHPCPEQYEGAERLLELYLAIDYNKQQRQDLGIDHLNPDDVTTITDEEVCGHIIHELRNNPMIQGNIDPEDWDRHFLQAGNYYFVEYIYAPADGPEGSISFSTARSTKHIFRSDFTVLYSWAPTGEYELP